MPQPLNVLLVEDNPVDAELIERELRRAGFALEVKRVDNEQDFVGSLHDQLDLVISDFHLPQFNGMRALELLQQSRLNTPFIIVSGTIGEETAVEAMRLGAMDYLLKDRLARLGQAVTHVLEEKRLRLEHRVIEAKLLEKQDELLTARHIARLAYWEVDAAKGLFTFNDQFYELLRTTAGREGGYTMSAAEYVRRFVHAEDRELVRLEMEKALGSDNPNYDAELDHRILYPDGQVGYFNVRIRIEKDNLGRTLKTRGANLDITERKRSEEVVRHLAAFPELNPNPVLEFSHEGGLVYHNPAAIRLLRKMGIANLEQALPLTTQSIVAECLVTGQPQLGLETIHGRTTLSWSFYPITDQRTVHCYVGDITDRVQLEYKLRQSQKMEAIGQLAGGVAHDFNNMLTAIIGHLGLLHGNPQVTPEIAESLSEISAAANRAANLTSQLLAFSRRQVMNTSALNLNEVVTHLTKMLRRILGEEVIMQLDYAPEQLTFYGDAGMMEQVLVNLAVNARDAMPNGGTLRIVTRAETRVPPVMEGQAETGEAAAFVRLSVSDTGTGIPPEIKAKIFEPFFTTKDVGKGTGLGLATAFGIVQQHHGWIEVESELGQSTIFHVYLPRLATGPSVGKVEPIIPPDRGRGELVLLVEDESSVRELGKLALSRSGYRVLTAENGPAALEVWAMHQAEIALLFTDMVMPDGISGQQLARQLLEEKPSLKVVYTSGYNAEMAGKELKLTDGVNYLAKPYELDRLFRTVRAALDGSQSRPPF